MTGSTLIKIAGADFDGPLIPSLDYLESAGSLFLFDVSDNETKFKSIPATNTEVKNILASNAAKIIDSPESLASGKIIVGVDNNYNKMEITGKGAIHSAFTQKSGSVASSSGYYISPSDAIKQYMINNINHDFYISAWYKLTRNQLPLNAPIPNAVWALRTSSFAFILRGGDSANGVGVFDPTGNNVTNPIGTDKLISTHFSGLTITDGSTSEQVTMNPIMFNMSSFPNAWRSVNNGLMPSGILYRAYIEDLTVSGRSFSEVSEIDLRIKREAFSEGGVFYGDTYTPAQTLIA